MEILRAGDPAKARKYVGECEQCGAIIRLVSSEMCSSTFGVHTGDAHCPSGCGLVGVWDETCSKARETLAQLEPTEETR